MNNILLTSNIYNITKLVQCFADDSQFSKKETREWVDTSEELWTLRKKLQMLDNHYDKYIKYLQKEYFSNVELDLVIYDEIENFRESDDDLFMYPYGSRKNKLATFQLNSEFFEYKEDEIRIEYDSFDYKF